MANTFLTKAGYTANIPALLRPDGSWAMDLEEKANELAETLCLKAKLQSAVSNAYSHLLEHPPGAQQNGFLRIGICPAFKFLGDLDEQSGTGPDLLSAIIPKKCALRPETSRRLPLAAALARQQRAGAWGASNGAWASESNLSCLSEAQ